MKMRRSMRVPSAAALNRITFALFVNTVANLRRDGLTDRAIARKFDLPRWIIRAVR